MSSRRHHDPLPRSGIYEGNVGLYAFKPVLEFGVRLPASVPARDSSWLALGVASLVIASPLRHLWAADARPWYLPFVVWLAMIVLPRLLSRRGDGS
jgi:hypothetical protein